MGSSGHSAGSDTASSEDAAGGLETREREFRFLGMHDTQEAEHSADAGQAFHATVAESEGDEEASGPGTRVDGVVSEREGREADYRGAESRTSRLGKLLPD